MNPLPSSSLPTSAEALGHARVSPGEDASPRLGRRMTQWCAWLVVSLVAPWVLAAQEDFFLDLRESMVEQQVLKRGINASSDLLSAMREVPRHLFVPSARREDAYRDQPVTIGEGKTLYQAYLSARMITLLELEGDEKVLEVGTGSGYDAALLSRLTHKVYTVEIDEKIGRQAEAILERLGYDNVRVKIGDGYHGWQEKGPFDAILLTTAPKRIPPPLFEQLKVGGRMVVPVGAFFQDLQVITKAADGSKVRKIEPVRVAPMEGEIRSRD